MSQPPPPPDLYMPPDFSSPCGWGQQFSGGSCICAPAYPQGCAANTYCCASSQSCLTGLGPRGETRCSGPTVRWGLGMAYDLFRDRTVLRAGACENSMTGADVLCTDQWELNSITWQPLGTVAGPGPRHGHSMIWDGTTNQILLFGGRSQINNDASATNDTWLFDGSKWAQRTTATSPPARTNHAMAYDGVRRRTVMFGGSFNNNAISGTWEWDGANWLLRNVVNEPTEREGHVMVFDEKLKAIVMFGGFDMGFVSDTWKFDGSDWSRISTGAGMTGRAYHTMVYDPDRKVSTMFGGEYGGTILGETWEFDGSNWFKKNPVNAPPGRVNAGMVYDPGRKQTLLFGGVGAGTGVLKDLWAWDGTNWRQLY